MSYEALLTEFINSRNMSTENKDGKDVFRDTPVRLLGYANEVGEAFRGLISNRMVNFTYGIASTYVFADASHKALNVDLNSGNGNTAKKMLITFGDVLLWQTLASVIIPGFIINRICFATRLWMRNIKTNKLNKQYLVSGVGLLSIPIIIRPIDAGVDFMMDRFVRPFYKK